MESLGIDLKLFIAQVVNFLIVMLLLWKFAYNPVLKMLDDRREKIEKGVKDAEEAAKSKAAAQIEAEKIQEKAYSDANEILKNAQAAAVAEGAELIKKASSQADRILKTAKDEANSAKDKTLAEAKKEISGIITLALDKIVGEELNQENKNKLTAKAIQEL
jgi:F-type H+-transporting ATPase subunit b